MFARTTAYLQLVSPDVIRQLQNGTIALVFVFVTGTAGYMFLCHWSLADALYMLIITVSSVGYGEIGPRTSWDRVVTSYVIVAGITAAAYTFGAFVQLMAEARIREILSRQLQDRKIESLNTHHIVCGYGRMGALICADLTRRKQPFVLVEADRERVSAAEALGYLVVLGDATEEGVLLRAGIARAKTLVSVLPSDADNVFVTLTARDMNGKLFIASRAERPSTQKKLEQAGANRVVSPQVIGAQRITNLLFRPVTMEILELATGHESLDLQMDEIQVPEDTPVQGKTLADLEVGTKLGALVVAIRRQDSSLVSLPLGSTPIHPGDTIIVLSRIDQMDRFRNIVRGKRVDSD
jgi:voltage-gated potassium channel